MVEQDGKLEHVALSGLGRDLAERMIKIFVPKKKKAADSSQRPVSKRLLEGPVALLRVFSWRYRRRTP